MCCDESGGGGRERLWIFGGGVAKVHPHTLAGRRGKTHATSALQRRSCRTKRSVEPPNAPQTNPPLSRGDEEEAPQEVPGVDPGVLGLAAADPVRAGLPGALPAERAARAAAAVPLPGAGEHRGATVGHQRLPGQRQRGRGAPSGGGGGSWGQQPQPGAHPHLPARHLEDGLVVPGGAVQPAPGRLLPLRAHVAHLAGAVPGGRGQPAGRRARHDGRAVPLRLLRAAAVRGRAEPHHLLHLRLEDEQGDLLGAAVRRAPPPPGGPGAGGAVRQVPAQGHPGAGAGVQEVPGGRHQGGAGAGPQHAGAAHEGPRGQPAGGAALPRPARRAQLAAEVQAGAGEGEHPGAAEQEAGRQVQAAAGAQQPRQPRRELRVQRHGAHLRQLAGRHDAGDERAALAAARLHASALRGPGAAAHGGAAAPLPLLQPGQLAGAGEVRAQHDARPGLLVGQALPHLLAGRQGGHLRVEGEAERGADRAGGGLLQRGDEAAGVPQEQRGEDHLRSRQGDGGAVSRGLVFEAEGERWNNNTSSWNVAHWELRTRLQGCFHSAEPGR